MVIKFIPLPNGDVKMEIPALEKVIDRTQRYETVPNWTNKNGYFKAYVSFLDWVIQYVDSEIGASKNYSIDKLISTVFNPKNITKVQWVRQLDYYMYLCKLYAEKLKSQASIKNVPSYIKSVWLYVSDVENLVAVYEMEKKKTTTIFPSLTIGVRSQITTLDLKFAANELTYLNEVDKIEHLDFRDIQPCSIMVIRQALELLGKNLIGYINITDTNGGIVKQMTQIAWSFLKDNMGKSSWNISMPIQLSNILKVNKWANGYVHNPWVNVSYIRAFGLEVLCELMRPPKTNVKCYDGNFHRNTLYGDFRICGYSQLKNEFTNYVMSKKPNAIINWLPIDNVGGYIISL